MTQSNPMLIKTLIIKLNNTNLKQYFDSITGFIGDIDASNVGRSIVIDGKSLIGMMNLDFGSPIQVVLRTQDEDEAKRFVEVMKQFE